MDAPDKIYDLSYLSELYGDDQEALKHSVSVLLETLPRDIERFENAFYSKDWNAFFNAGHKLKTPVRMLRIGNIFTNMETMVEATRDGKYSSEVDDMFRQVLPVLKEAFIQLSSFVRK